jgi:hypothetical protein
MVRKILYRLNISECISNPSDEGEDQKTASFFSEKMQRNEF